ncbi:hypothetical protein Tco_0488499 [Tanacetum coccineum]
MNHTSLCHSTFPALIGLSKNSTYHTSKPTAPHTKKRLFQETGQHGLYKTWLDPTGPCRLTTTLPTSCFPSPLTHSLVLPPTYASALRRRCRCGHYETPHLLTLLSAFLKQVSTPPTSKPSSRLSANIHDFIYGADDGPHCYCTHFQKRRALGNNLVYIPRDTPRQEEICYTARRSGHVARQCRMKPNKEWTSLCTSQISFTDEAKGRKALDYNKHVFKPILRKRLYSRRGKKAQMTAFALSTMSELDHPLGKRPTNQSNRFYDKLNALMFVPQKELSGDQAYWLSANEIASQASKSATPATLFVRKSRPPSQVLASLRNVNAVFPQFEGIIKERTTQKPDYVSEWCFDYAKQFVEQQLVPFYDHFKKHIQAANDTFFKEIREFEQIFDELEAEYEQCVLDNKNLTIEKKNLLIINECLIAECLEKDICSIVLTSDIVVPPSSNCLCEDLRSACDREHTKVLELEAEISKQKQLISESEKRFAFLEQNYVSLQLKFQNYKQCIDTSSASNAIFEINKLRNQLQGKDDTIRNLETQINITRMLNVGSTEGSCDQQALETDRIQLQDMITSLRIQLDGLKVENVSLKRRYDELSQANTHSRTANTEKLSALTAENTKLKAQVTGKTSSGPSTSETPKVLAPGMYNLGSKYIPPPKRANWVKPTPLPKKKQVTFSEPSRPSLKPTQKPVVHPKKQTNVCVPMSTGVKPTSGASKTVPKRAPRNHSSLPVKSANARRVEAHHRTLNKKNRVDSNLLVKHSVSVSKLNNVCAACNKSLVFANHNDCLVMCDDSVNVKPHQTKRFKRQPKKEWKPIKRVWKPISKPVANSKPQWKPTGRHFSLFEKYPLTRIMEPTDMPIELPPSASSSPQITMVSRFIDHKLSDRKAGSTNCSMVARLTAYKFKTDCSIIPVWPSTDVLVMRTSNHGKSNTSVLDDPTLLSGNPVSHGDSLDFLITDGDGDASFQLESDSLPHTHAQTTKISIKHQDSRI